MGFAAAKKSSFIVRTRSQNKFQALGVYWPQLFKNHQTGPVLAPNRPDAGYDQHLLTSKKCNDYGWDEFVFRVTVGLGNRFWLPIKEITCVRHDFQRDGLGLIGIYVVVVEAYGKRHM